MSVRVSESWTARNGHRRSVSMNLGTYVLGSIALCFSRGIWGLMILPFVLCWWVLLAYLWLAAEIVLLAVTGLLAIGAVLHREARPGDITFKVIRWHLLVLGLKGA